MDGSNAASIKLDCFYAGSISLYLVYKGMKEDIQKSLFTFLDA